MLKNYIKVALENILRNKLILFINVIGLGAALTCCIIAYLNWEFNKKFNAFHTNAERIFKVNSISDVNGEAIRFGVAPLPLGPATEREISGVEKAVRYLETRAELKFGRELFGAKLGFVDHGFLDVFTFDIVQGNKPSPNNKNEVLISKVLAEKHFNGQNPVGQFITIDYKNEGEKSYVVSGVFGRIPLNSSFKFDVLLPFENFMDLGKKRESDWSGFAHATFLMLKDPAQYKEVEAQLTKYIALQNRAREDWKIQQFYMEPLMDMAGNLEQIRGNVLSPGLPDSAVMSPIIMAVLMLLLACFNFSNSALAMSSSRLKEIGLRKVMGGTSRQIMIQFLSENVLICLVALIVALFLSSVFVPAYSALWSFLEIEFDFFKNWNILLISIGLLVLTGILAGAYPAFYVGSFDPTKIFGNSMTRFGTNRFMRVLLVFQFSIVLVALITGMVFSRNADYQKGLDMGFDHQQTIVVVVNNKSEYDVFKNKLVQHKQLLKTAGSEGHIGHNVYGSAFKSGAKEQFFEGINVSPDFLETAGLTLVQGRNFEKGSALDKEESLLVTEQLVREFGWENPINQKVTLNDSVQMYVIGVVKDIYMRGLWEPVQPMFLRMADENNYHFLTAKVNREDLIPMKATLENEWKKTFPNVKFKSFLQEEMLYEALTINKNIGQLFFILSIVALMLCSSGLYSMLSLNIIKKSKELGIRKILGASELNVAYHINKEFIIILLIAIVIGSVISYFFVDWLLGSIYTYHTKVNAYPIAVSILILIAISFVTVAYKVFKATKANPVEVLKR